MQKMYIADKMPVTLIPPLYLLPLGLKGYIMEARHLESMWSIPRKCIRMTKCPD
jgi:hypothetical protein